MIHGVTKLPLLMHQDSRGSLTEIFRANWDSRFTPVQWNAVTSKAGVLRGMHVHPRHWDYLMVLQGKMLLGLCDLRWNSATYRQSVFQTLLGDEHVAWSIPPGVAHGFFFSVPTTFVYGVSDYWSLEDEQGCQWDDPGLGLEWPILNPILSERDQQASSLAELMRVLDTFDVNW